MNVQTRWLRGAAATLALAVAAQAGAATRVLVVSGLGGEAQYDERFESWGAKVAHASATAAGDASQVQRLAGTAATREPILAALRAQAEALKAGDQFVLVLLGHGSYDGNEYRFNIAGPDVTGTEIGAALDRIPQGVAQLVINATSTSGAVAERWSKPNRVVITATRSGGERNATRFGAYWAEALGSSEADRDKNGEVTAQEAYDYALRKVADAYKSDAAVLTERAKLTGDNPGRFVVARLGPTALFASDMQLRAMRGEQEQIELRIAQLREQKAQLGEDEYYNRLEPVLVDLAKVGVRIDARLAALGANSGGQK